MGLHAEISVRLVPSREGSRTARIQNSGRQKQKYNLDPSAVFTGVNDYLSEELSQSARGNAIKIMSAFIAVIWVSHALNDPLPFLFSLSPLLRSS